MSPLESIRRSSRCALRILDVLLLLPADHATLEERVHEIYEWRVDYAKDAAKSTVATSVSFAAAVIVSLFKTELHVAWYWITLGLCAAVAIATFGVVAYVRVARLHSEYAAAIAIVRSVARP
jgi:hypothetical protein